MPIYSLRRKFLKIFWVYFRCVDPRGTFHQWCQSAAILNCPSILLVLLEDVKIRIFSSGNDGRINTILPRETYIEWKPVKNVMASQMNIKCVFSRLQVDFHNPLQLLFKFRFPSPTSYLCPRHLVLGCCLNSYGSFLYQKTSFYSIFQSLTSLY